MGKQEWKKGSLLGSYLSCRGTLVLACTGLGDEVETSGQAVLATSDAKECDNEVKHGAHAWPEHLRMNGVTICIRSSLGG